MAEPAPRQANGVAATGSDANDTTTASNNRLAAPISQGGGGRRSPTTGHVRRRRPDQRSSSSPREEVKPPVTDHVSTSEDDEEYWHAYFAVQSKHIAAHNGSSIAAAAAGVLRPGPPRRPSAAPPLDRERRRTDTSTISRKSTAEKGRGLGDRRPSAPDFSVMPDDDGVLPPTPKPALRRRVRSKSSGAPLEQRPRRPPSPTDSDDTRRNTTASETSSTTSKTETRKQVKGDKSIIWKKWTQAAPPPAKKEVLSIDPAEVLRGLVQEQEGQPESLKLPEIEKENAIEQGNEQQEDTKHEEVHDLHGGQSEEVSEVPNVTEVAEVSEVAEAQQADTEPVENGGSKKLKRNSSLRKAEVVRKSSLRKERPTEKKEDERQQPKQARQSRLRKWLTVVRDLDLRGEWRAFRQSHPTELARLRLMWNRCLASLLLMMLYCGVGGFIFRFIEGAFESFYKCGVKRVKRDFIDMLWTSSHNLREEEWKSRARRKLWELEEQLHAAHEAGVTSYSGIKSWSFLNAVVYCLTVVTTIGYGHISPSTNTGRAATIIYAIFGIPMFLILLADFGKLFTRGIKFMWSFVRRLYYTGSCRQVRRTQPVQSAMGICFYGEIMKGAQMVYDLATFRRPSMFPPQDGQLAPDPENAIHIRPPESSPRRDHPDSSEPPATPAPSAFEVDDEFNLPISVAIFILLLYIFVGASIYYIWESWGFFESFYFVFISMSTIGFGDFVPQHPMYMMASIIYLVFGLALTSMCINVVQEKLSDSFRQASAKIGATIGLRIAEEEASTNPQTPASAPAAAASREGEGEREEGREEPGERIRFLSPNNDMREVHS